MINNLKLQTFNISFVIKGHDTKTKGALRRFRVNKSNSERVY